MEDLIRFYENPQARAIAGAAALLIPRVLPVVLLTPIVGGNLLPRRMRVGLTLFLIMVLTPAVIPQALAAPPVGIGYWALAAKELLIGLTLSTMVLIMYHTFSAFGAVIDVARGATIANVFDPATQQQQSILGTFFLHVAIVLFLSIGGLHVVINALADSLVAMPVYEPLPARLVGEQAALQILALSGELFVTAIRLAAPALIVLVLLDIVLGLLNRVAPQVQVYFLGLTVKSTLGLFMVFLSLGVTFALFYEHFGEFLRSIRQWTILP